MKKITRISFFLLSSRILHIGASEFILEIIWNSFSSSAIKTTGSSSESSITGVVEAKLVLGTTSADTVGVVSVLVAVSGFLLESSVSETLSLNFIFFDTFSTPDLSSSFLSGVSSVLFLFNESFGEVT